jgi:hypothetical protein
VSAAINDAMAWCWLAFVVGVMLNTTADAIRTIAHTFALGALMNTRVAWSSSSSWTSAWTSV